MSALELRPVEEIASLHLFRTVIERIMSGKRKKLEDIRRKIDEIDTTIHEKLMERGRLIEDLQAAKGISSANAGTGAMRPSRESKMLNVLRSRHDGAFPLIAAERIWREIISTFTQLQSPFNILVADGKRDQLIEIVRFYFGATSPVSFRQDPYQLIEELIEDKTCVGVIGGPIKDLADGLKEPWWFKLVDDNNSDVRIVAKMPFFDHSEVDMRWSEEIWVLSQAPFDQSTKDVSMLAIEHQNKEDPLVQVKQFPNLENFDFSILDSYQSEDRHLSLLSADGYISPDEIDKFGSPLTHLGGYGVRA